MSKSNSELQHASTGLSSSNTFVRHHLRRVVVELVETAVQEQTEGLRIGSLTMSNCYKQFSSVFTLFVLERIEE